MPFDFDSVDTGATAWVLASGALVLLMTPGLAFFYGGMVRAKSVLNMLMMSFVAIGSSACSGCSPASPSPSATASAASSATSTSSACRTSTRPGSLAGYAMPADGLRRPSS